MDRDFSFSEQISDAWYEFAIFEAGYSTAVMSGDGSCAAMYAEQKRSITAFINRLQIMAMTAAPPPSPNVPNLPISPNSPNSPDSQTSF